MKHKILIISAITAAFFAITGCNKKLDVVPFQSLPPEKALLTEGDLLGVLVGGYNALQSGTTYGGDMQLMADIWANRRYQRFRGTFAGLQQIAAVTTTSNPIQVDNGWAASLWAGAYRAINSANIVLDNLALAKGNLKPKDFVEGEALFIRGSMYFELVRLFGKTWGDGNNNTNLAVPLVLKPTPFEESKLNESNYPKRNTVAEIYNQAKADLQRAATLLPEENGYYATKWAAMAQLSRIALMQEDYATARDMANQVIASNFYELEPVFGDLFFTFINFSGVASDEYIFYIRNTNQDASNSLNTYYGGNIGIAGTAGRTDIDIQTAWVNLHEANDYRRTFFFVTSQPRRLTLKHVDRFGHVPVIRLAEMYLTRAEANFRLGTTVGNTPTQDINIIRRRVGLTDLGSVTLADILKERDLELAFEGHYLHDRKRNRLSAQGSTGLNGPAWNSPRLVMPIPQREMDVNKNLVQNEGY